MWTQMILNSFTVLTAASESRVNYTMAIIWLGVIVAAIAIESVTAEMVSIWFAPAAFVSMILSFFCNFTVQLIVFVALSVVLITATKIIAAKREKKDKDAPPQSGIEQLIGKQAVVVEAIDNCAEQGVVRINGQLWSARMESDNDKPAEGDHLTIVQVCGSKLICRPQN